MSNYADGTWSQTPHRFTDAPAGLPYVYFEGGGTDGEHWAGNDGVELDGAAVVLCD